MKISKPALSVGVGRTQGSSGWQELRGPVSEGPRVFRGSRGSSAWFGGANLWFFTGRSDWYCHFSRAGGAGAAYCICRFIRECMCFINGVNALCFWLMGHQSHSCWVVIDFPTQLLQLCHRCSLSEVRASVVSHGEDPNWSDPWEIGHCKS